MRILLIVLLVCDIAGAQTARPRARDVGITVGVFPPGPLNAITDVAGVAVGHATLIQGDDVRTGVTAILPHQRNLFHEKVAGAVFIGNAFGKLVGSTQVEELGEIETPILLTSTLNVWRVADAVVDYMLALPGNETVQSINPVVGEINDGWLNDIRGRHVGRDEVFAAIRNGSRAPLRRDRWERAREQWRSDSRAALELPPEAFRAATRLECWYRPTMAACLRLPARRLGRSSGAILCWKN